LEFFRIVFMMAFPLAVIYLVVMIAARVDWINPLSWGVSEVLLAYVLTIGFILFVTSCLVLVEYREYGVYLAFFFGSTLATQRYSVVLPLLFHIISLFLMGGMVYQFFL